MRARLAIWEFRTETYQQIGKAYIEIVTADTSFPDKLPFWNSSILDASFYLFHKYSAFLNFTIVKLLDVFIFVISIQKLDNILYIWLYGLFLNTILPFSATLLVLRIKDSLVG